MGNLEEEFASIIISWYEGLLMGTKDIIELAMQGPAAFNKEIWSFITIFNEKAVLPVAYTLMSIFLLIELYRVINKSDGMERTESYFYFMQFAVKMVVAKLCMDNILLIINAIFSISASILSNSAVADATSKVIFNSDGFADYVQTMDFWSLLMSLLGCFLIFVANMVCGFLAKMVVMMRFLEIYVYSAVAPLAISTMPSEEYNSIGKNNIKTFAALALQSVFIVIVIYFYQILTGSASFEVSAGSNILFCFGEIFVYSLLCVICLFNTGKWSKSLCQAN